MDLYQGSKHRKHHKINKRNERKMEIVRREIIGKQLYVEGPFGKRLSLYFDHTASGKSLKCIEDYINEKILPSYGNTHTTSSFTAAQTTALREESRAIIKNSVGASEEDVLIFHGSGTTAIVHKLIHSIYPIFTDKKQKNPVIFIGPYEHHSNILPWRESKTKVIQVPESKLGIGLDLEYLELMLKRYSEKSKTRLLIGSFSAGSNVTGALTDDIEVTILLHRYGALSLWDYAAAAPHVKIEMNPKFNDPSTQWLARKDAIFFSGHKFIGGPQTTGVLIAKKKLFVNPIPHGSGGGTVLFVTNKNQRYLHKIEEKEEGGTPAILESIRLGLVFKIQNFIGQENIMETENSYLSKAMKEWKKVPEIIILGFQSQIRLPIISFLIKDLKTGFYLHHNFIVTVLNDLFGIQCRGGCMCAGPYSQKLLGIGEKITKKYIQIISENNDEKLLFRPGFVRISFSYESSIEEVEFVIQAVILVAKKAKQLLNCYTRNIVTGTFQFSNFKVPLIKLADFKINRSKLINNDNVKIPFHQYAMETLESAENIFSKFACISSQVPLIKLADFKINRSKLINNDNVKIPFHQYAMETLESAENIFSKFACISSQEMKGLNGDELKMSNSKYNWILAHYEEDDEDSQEFGMFKRNPPPFIPKDYNYYMNKTNLNLQSRHFTFAKSVPAQIVKCSEL